MVCCWPRGPGDGVPTRVPVVVVLARWVARGGRVLGGAAPAVRVWRVPSPIFPPRRSGRRGCILRREASYPPPPWRGRRVACPFPEGKDRLAPRRDPCGPMRVPVTRGGFSSIPQRSPQRIRCGSSLPPQRFRSGSAAVPRFLRSGSAAVPHFLRSGSAVVPQAAKAAFPMARSSPAPAAAPSQSAPPRRRFQKKSFM